MDQPEDKRRRAFHRWEAVEVLGLLNLRRNSAKNVQAKPQVLKWARVRTGLTEDELAQRLNLETERVREWEASGEIAVVHAEKLATTTNTPYGYLFLDTPPQESLPIKDFRTVGSGAAKATNLNLIDLVRQSLARQEWYREYLVSLGEEKLDFVGSLTINTPIPDAANRIRHRMRIGTELRQRTGSYEDILRVHFDAVEQCGVLVAREGGVGNSVLRKVSVDEFRGFALADDYAPMVVINSNDAKAAQLFTLVHELVHIWIGESAVSTLQRTIDNGHLIERFCNAVAAEVLVPLEELKTNWRRGADRQEEIKRLAGRVFKVSQLVICRRAFDAGILTKTEFEAIYEEIELEYIRRSKRPKTSGGPSFYRVLPAQVGHRLTNAVVSSAVGGETLYRDAMRLLGVANINTFHELSRRLGFVVGK